MPSLLLLGRIKQKTCSVLQSEPVSSLNSLVCCRFIDSRPYYERIKGGIRLGYPESVHKIFISADQILLISIGYVKCSLFPLFLFLSFYASGRLHDRERPLHAATRLDLILSVLFC